MEARGAGTLRVLKAGLAVVCGEQPGRTGKAPHILPRKLFQLLKPPLLSLHWSTMIFPTNMQLLSPDSMVFISHVYFPMEQSIKSFPLAN